MNPSFAGTRLGTVGTIAIALATALVLVALAILPFLSPAWVGFEQGRTGAAALTGFSDEGLRTATDAILGDLVLGPPDFDVEVNGRAVLTGAERAHMRDVRGVFAAFYAAAALGAAVLGAGFWLASRPGPSSWTRRQAWRAVRRGALGLGAGVVVAGVIALLAFDAAFAVFHQLFFAGGNYLFDPATSKLVQLFPDAFWMESTMAVGGVILILAAATAGHASRRVRSGADLAVTRGARSRPDADALPTMAPVDPGAAR